MKRRRESKSYNPIFMITILTIIIMVVSLVFSIIGIDAQRASINNDTLETSLVVVKNIFSINGLQYLFSNITSNFAILEPLALLIVSLMGVSIGVTSGLFSAIFYPLRKVNLNVLTFLTLFLGIISSFFGGSAYVILIPLIATMYQYIGRNPMVGAITAFLGITVGYGVNVMFTYDDYLLGTLTQLAARADIDKSYQYHLMSTHYISIATTFLLSIIGTIIINRFLSEKLPKKYKINDELKISKKGILVSTITFVALVLVFVYMTIPGLKLPGSGSLLDFESDVYIEQLLGPNSPFAKGIVLIVSGIIMICSFIYGMISGNMKDNHEYGVGLAESFKDLGYLFVLLFFVSLMTSVLEYTNLGIVISCLLMDMISTIPISGIPLIVIGFLIILIIGILIPNTHTKWELASPIMIPLFMRANITPEFTQFLFRAADGMGKCISPVFVYFIVLIGFLQKYNRTEKDITIFGTFKLMMPSIILFAVLWLLILIGWFVVGLPLGSGSYVTL